MLTKYYEQIIHILGEIKDTQADKIKSAACMVADTIKTDGIIYIFGCGHSHLIGLDCFYRAGGLVNVSAMLDTDLMLHNGAAKSSVMEKMSGIAESIFERYCITEKDMLIVISTSGKNAVPVEMCIEAKKVGAKVIAMTNMKHSASCESRHSSGKKMYELADVTIDNWGDIGDASFPIEGLDTCIGPTSDAVGITIAQALVCEVVDKLVKEGMEPPIFKSSNVDGGDEHNHEMFEKYYGYWK